MNSGSPSRPQRDTSLDALRGLAVVAMVVWHVTDGWLAVAHREGAAWHTVRVFGGLAAPLFLFVAGAAVSRARAAGKSIGGIVFRGVGVIALGGLLRIHNWLVDAGGAAEWTSLAPAALGMAGYGALLFADHRKSRRAWAVGGVLLLLFGWRVGIDVPQHAARILAVDVLSCIGAAIVGCALASRLPSWLVFSAGATVVCIAEVLPEVGGNAWLAGWLGTPHADSARYALFPLFPWAGYSLVGLGLAGATRRPWRHSWLVGVALAVACFEGGLPWSRRLLHELPALRPLFRFGFHLGGIVALASAARLLRRCRPLIALGRVSLPVYWVHLEIAYGLLSVPFARVSTPVSCALGATLVLVVATVTAVGAAGVFRSPTSLRRGTGSRANSRA